MLLLYLFMQSIFTVLRNPAVAIKWKVPAIMLRLQLYRLWVHESTLFLQQELGLTARYKAIDLTKREKVMGAFLLAGTRPNP